MKKTDKVSKHLGKIFFVFVVLYLFALNWPILNWAFSISKPPGMLLFLGAPFVVVWGTAWSLIFLGFWILYQMRAGLQTVKRVEEYFNEGNHNE